MQQSAPEQAPRQGRFKAWLARLRRGDAAPEAAAQTTEPLGLRCEAGLRHPLALAEIAQGKARVQEHVEALKGLSEREIFACGNVLSSLVERVQALIEAAEATVASSLARSDESTARFVSEIQADLQRQEASVSQVMQLADSIEETIRALGRLAEYSNILALNSKIEAARIGEQGKGFVTIADHIRDLSLSIQQTTESVKGSVAAMREGLPPVIASADTMQDRTRAFIVQVSEQLRSASLQSEAAGAGSQLEAVMRLSNEALSHLQFQDSLSQKLTAIPDEIALVGQRVERVLDGDTGLESLSPDAPGEDDQLSAGEVILF